MELNTDVISGMDQDYLMEAIEEVMLGTKETRVKLTTANFRLFCKYYFDIDPAAHQQRWHSSMMPAKRGLVLGPCGHGKTEIFSKLRLLFFIIRNRYIRALLVSKSDGLAVKNLKSIKYELKNNKKLIEDFGRFWDKSNTWTDHQLYVIRDKNMKDPTVEAVGLLGAITGGRFDIIILDDVLDVLNCNSEDQRNKIRDYIDGTLIPRLEPWGVVHGIGTRKHYDDYYGHCVKNKAWKVVHDMAIVKEPSDYEVKELDESVMVDDGYGNMVESWYHVDVKSNDGECLWPQKWPMKDLLVLRLAIGTSVFSREYQNIVASDADALFKLSWLTNSRRRDLSYVTGPFHTDDVRNEFIAIFQGFDLALIDDKKKAEKRDSDYTVGITWGLTRKRERVLLGLVRERGLTPKQVQNLIKTEYLRFKPQYSIVESNNFGSIHINTLIEEEGLNLIPHMTTGKKNDVYRGVPSMAVPLENGKVFLPYSTPEDQKLTDTLINEFHMLGMEDHDDIPMATWIAWTGIDRFIAGDMRIMKNKKRVEKPKRVRNVRQQSAR